MLGYRVTKRVKKVLAEGKDYVRLFFQENKCISGQGSWKNGTRQAKYQKYWACTKELFLIAEATGKIPKAKSDSHEQLQVLYKRKY